MSSVENREKKNWMSFLHLLEFEDASNKCISPTSCRAASRLQVYNQLRVAVDLKLKSYFPRLKTSTASNL